MRRATSGLALIVVVGVLGVLSVLAVAFVTMAQLERKASLQRINAVKAYMLARSGIEDAQARVGMGQDPLASCNRYAGEDWNANGTLDGVEVANEVYHPTGAGTLPDTDTCPVRYAMRPSFFVGLPTAPSLVQVDGWARGYSGRLTGDSGSQGNHYALKVEGAGGFYVNGGDPSHHSDPTATTDYNTMLRRVLGVLCDAIDHEDGVGDGNPVAQADGWALIDQRPLTSMGWQSYDQIRDLALGGNQAKLNALKPYLTLHAWVDKKVIAPSATADMGGKPYEDWSAIKLSRTPNPAAPTNHAPDFERIPRAPGGNIVGRAPVDLAWARTRRPALIALIANLQGLYIDQITGKQPITVGVLSPVQITLDWTQPIDDCRTAVGAILTSTSSLSTWQQWNDFSNSLSLTGTPDQAQAKRDLLKANFNPNSDLNKFNPNPSLWKLMDKSDLLVYSTEFNLLPGLGGQQVSCVGRVLGASGKLLASRTFTAVVGGPSVLRLSTQRDFVNDESGNPRMPGTTPYITANAAPVGETTWGQALPGIPSGPGFSLQSYPEPYFYDVASGKLKINPADYDGNLQLATVETPDTPWAYYQTPPPVPGTEVLMMLARFTDSLDLDVSRAKITVQAPPAAPDLDWDKNQTDTSQVSTAQLGTGLLQEVSKGSGIINTLYPDGSYSDWNRCPSYLDRDFIPDQGNSDGFRGALSFWVKVNDPIASNLDRTLLDRSRHRYASATGQLLAIWWQPSFFQAVIETKVENYNSGNQPQYHDFWTPANSQRPAHRWTLLTLGWDFRAKPNDFGLGELLVDGGDPQDSTSYPTGWPLNDNNSPGTAEDITKLDTYGLHRVWLGEQQRTDWTSPLATYDEFAVYDFGGAIPPGPVPDDAQGAPGKLAKERYRIGRYYRESAYPSSMGLLTPLGSFGRRAAEWFSGKIDLGAVTIQNLAWTQIVPRGLKAPVPAVGWNGRPPQPGWDGDDDTGDDPGDGRIVFELADTSGGAYLNDTGSPPQPISNLFTQDALSPVGRSVNTPFRLHAVFQPNLADRAGTPLLDSLVLDDITLTYWKASGPELNAWQEGE